MNSTLSICVSAYNAEMYLSRCLDSIYSQSLSEIEIVLVDDGSTDKTYSIMKDYKQKYPNRNTKIISQKNQGLSIGRRTGVQNATSDYIAFVDADDYVLPDTYEKMISKAIENDLDIVECDAECERTIIKCDFEGIVDAKRVLTEYLYNNVRHHIYPMLWMRIYKKNLFEKSTFVDMYVNNEDIFAFPCILYKAERMGYIHESLYFYSSDNNQSVMQRLKNKENVSYIRENKLRKLKAPCHVEEFINRSCNEESIIDCLSVYKQSFMVEYLFTYMQGIRYDDKLRDIMIEYNYSKKSELIAFIKNKAINGNKKNTLISILGLKNTYYIYMLKHY